MNAANKITLSRIIMIPIFMVCLLGDFRCAEIIAVALFLLAAVTDSLDGYVARKYNQITTFGKFIDPLADKLLVIAAIIGLVFQGRVGPWFAFVIIAREFIVTGLRMLAVAEGGKVIAAEVSGKIKTVTQIVAITALLIDKIYEIRLFEINISYIFLVIAVAMTLYSGVEYLIRNRSLIKQ